jgi:hypothetical protein
MWLEATPGIEPGYADLQSAASPLRHVAPRAKLLRHVKKLCNGFVIVLAAILKGHTPLILKFCSLDVPRRFCRCLE